MVRFACIAFFPSALDALAGHRVHDPLAPRLDVEEKRGGRGKKGKGKKKGVNDLLGDRLSAVCPPANAIAVHKIFLFSYMFMGEERKRERGKKEIPR